MANTTNLTPPLDKNRSIPLHTWMTNVGKAIQNIQTGNAVANGVWSNTFQSGPIQYAGANGQLYGMNHFIVGTQLPGPGAAYPGTPGMLLGSYWANGQISELFQIIQDVAVAGNNGISMIISAGATGTPDLPTDQAGFMLVTSGYATDGNAGPLFIQGAPSVNGQGASVFVSAGGGKIPGDVFITGALSGNRGSNVQIIMTDINNFPGDLVIKCNSTTLLTITNSGAMFFSNTGAGNANTDVLISGGTGAPPHWGPVP